MTISKQIKLKEKFYLINASITIVEKEGIRHYFLKGNNGDLLKIDKIDYLILNNLQTYGKIENELMILLKNNSYKKEDILKKINLYKKKHYLVDLDSDIDLIVNRNVFYRLNEYTYERENQLLLGNLNMKDKEYLFRKDEKKNQYNHLFKVSFQKQLSKNQTHSKEDIIQQYKEFYFKNYLFYSIEIEKENLRYFICNKILQKENVTKAEIMLEAIYLLEVNYRNYLNEINDVYDEVFFTKLLNTLIHETLLDCTHKGIIYFSIK